MVPCVEAEFSSDAREFAEFVSEAVGAVEVPIKPLDVAEMES